MIIGKVFDPLTEINWNGEDPLAPDSLASKINLKAIIKTHKLDLKQAATFEILACSFILNSLDDYKVTEDELSKLFSYNDSTRADKTAKLKELKNLLLQQGGTKDLVMLLSGMGGSGKSTVIKAFHNFAKHVSHFLHWQYDDNTVKITAMTGSAASLLDDANTLHMTACLNKKKVTDLDQKSGLEPKCFSLMKSHS